MVITPAVGSSQGNNAVNFATKGHGNTIIFAENS